MNEGGPYSSLKSSLKAGQLIEHTAQSPDVTLLVVGLSFTQLRRNVAWGPNHLQGEKNKSINDIASSWMAKMCPTKKVNAYVYRISFTFADKDFGDAKISNFDNHLVLV